MSYNPIKIENIGGLKILQIGDKIGLGYNDTTGEQGFLIKVQAGEAVEKGDLLWSNSTSGRCVKQQIEYFTDYVCATSGAENDFIWAWTSGSLCKVKYDEGIGSTQGYVAVSSVTSLGRAKDLDRTDIIAEAMTTGNSLFKTIGTSAETVEPVEATVQLILIRFKP